MSSEPVSLDVRGYRGDVLEHVYMQQELPTGKLGLLLPGMGYGLKQPGLRYASLVLDNLGFDTFGLETRYNTPEFQALPGEEAETWLAADVLAAYRAAMAARTYARVCVVGKSLGTLGLHLLLRADPLPGARLVWLTPLLERTEVRERILERAQDSLVVIGTLDPHFRPEWIEELRQAGATVLLLDGANHGLNVPGDAVKALEYIHTVMRAMRDFVA